MKYAIRLRTGQWLYMLSEYEGNARKPWLFESIDEAETYAIEHQLVNYTIETLKEDQGKRLLNG